MKRSKVMTAVALCLVVAFTMVSCGAPYSGVKTEDYVKIAKYKGLAVEPVKVKVTDKEVNTEIKTKLDAAVKTEKKTTGVVKDKDTVYIDYVGKLKGKEFDGGSGKDKALTIGSNEFIPGFESGLVGVKVGDTKDLKLSFPKDYSTKELAGKAVVFTVKVKAKDVSTKPELNDDFVKENSKKSKTVAEYKKEVKKDLEKKKIAEAKTSQKTTLWSGIVQGSAMLQDDKGKDKYPQKELDRVEKETTKFYEETAKKSNMELKDFVKQNFGMDEKTFAKQIKEYAKVVVKEELVLYGIAKAEKIEISKDEYKKYIETELAKYGYTEESYKEANGGKSYEDVLGKERVEQAALKDKVMQFIVDNGKIKKK